MILVGLRPARASAVVAAIASGRFERKTATRNAALTAPACSTVRPSTSDSGMPSRMIPSTSALPACATCALPPSPCSRLPRRSIRSSAPKNTSEPARRPIATPPSPAVVSKASWTSSYATALIRTPAPNAMIKPTRRRLIENLRAMIPPSTSDEPASAPQRKCLAHQPDLPDRPLRWSSIIAS